MDKLYNKIEKFTYFVCIFMLIINCILLFGDGIIRDSYNQKLNTIELWRILSILCISCLILLWVLPHFKKTVVKNIILVVLIFGVGISSYVLVNNIVRLNNILSKYYFKQSWFIEINLEELSAVISKDKTARIYIERTSCAVCNSVYPELEKYLDEKNETILYYNTQNDRDDNYDNLMDVLNKFGVHSVPVVVEVENGDIVNIYCGKEIMEKFTM